MPPKGKVQPLQATIPPPNSIQTNVDHTVSFPEFSSATVLAFNITIQEKKETDPKKSASKAPKGKGASDIDWNEYVEKNWKNINKDFVNDILNDQQHSQVNISNQDSILQDDQEINSEHENKISHEDNQKINHEIEWRAMNRMTIVYSNVAEHPFPDTFFQSTTSIDENVEIDEELLKDASANYIDQLNLYSKYCTDFRLPESDNTLLQDSLKPFLSAIYFIIHNQKHINISLGFGNMLWELIYPKRDLNSQIPIENDIYLVKLWYNGAWRLIAVDSKMPYSLSTKQLQLPQTKNFEYWPSILFKALMVLSGSESKDDIRRNLLFKDPLWCVQSLCGPYLPRSFFTSNSLQALKIIRNSLNTHNRMLEDTESLLKLYSKRKYIHSRNAQDPITAGKIINHEIDEPHHVFQELSICATCVSPNQMLNFDESDKDYYYSVGLDPSILYEIIDIKYLPGKIALHIISYNHRKNWIGELSYNDSELWTADFEASLNFERQNRIIQSHAFTMPLVDFWIPFESFQQYFETIHILQNLSHLEKRINLFGENLQENFIVSIPIEELSDLNSTLSLTTYFLKEEEMAVSVKEDPKAKKGKAPTPQMETSLPIEGDPTETFQLIVETWDWKNKLAPQILIHSHLSQVYENLIQIPLPSIQSLNLQDSKSSQHNIFMKFTLNGAHKSRTVLKFLASKGSNANLITVATEFDILSQIGLQLVKFEPQPYPSHKENEWKIWFMQNISITQNSWFGAKLNIVNDSITDEGNNSTHHFSSEIIPLIDLLIVNNTTLETYHADIGCTLAPLVLKIPEIIQDPKSKQGPTGRYTLLAVAKSNSQPITEGKYSLELLFNETTTTITPVEKIETLSQSKLYKPNLKNELFNYVVWSGEESLGMFHLELDMNVPTKFQIENESGQILFSSMIDKRVTKVLHTTSIPLNLEPSQKGQERCLILRAFVDDSYNYRLLNEVIRTELHKAFEQNVINTPVENIEESQPKDDKKNAAKKPSASKPKGKVKQDTSRQIKIPSKQTSPQFISSIPNIDPLNIGNVDASSTLSKSNQNSNDYLSFLLHFSFTSPNVIIEEFDNRAQKIANFIETLEEKESDRLENGSNQRNNFFKQRARDYESNGRNNIEILENTTWKEEAPGKWLAKIRELDLKKS